MRRRSTRVPGFRQLTIQRRRMGVLRLGTIPAAGIVMKPAGFSLALATVLAGLASVGGASHQVAQPPAVSASTTVFRDIARRENPVVVSVMTRARVRGWGEADQEIFRVFELDPPEHIHLAAGSGFILSSAGDILTNSHVIEGAERIEVSLFGNDQKRYRAIRVGSDPQTDSALIRLQDPPPNLQSATLGDSTALEPGDWVMAIGNPFQLAHSVTVGVVSFPQRPIQVQDGRWQDLIQTDASINLGNSGGPLFNVRGEVVGMNVAIVDADGANAGIGFAVPINTVKALLPQLRTGKVVRGQLGVQLHGGPILEDEASELRLPRASGAIVMMRRWRLGSGTRGPASRRCHRRDRRQGCRRHARSDRAHRLHRARDPRERQDLPRRQRADPYDHNRRATSRRGRAKSPPTVPTPMTA